MYIESIEYSGKYRSLDLFIRGCKGPHCKNCHNPSLWAFTKEDNLAESTNIIQNYINRSGVLIDKFFLYGGEPLNQPVEELLELLVFLKSFDREIVLFTRYSLEEVPLIVKSLCTYIKCGRFEVENKGRVVYHGITLESLNQRVYKKNVDY